MLSQVTFTAQNDLKELALTKAKREGLSLKTVLVYALKGFVSGQISFGLNISTEEPEVEQIKFNDPAISVKARKLAKLLK